MLLLLLVNFVSAFRLELMHISLIVNTKSSLIHLTYAATITQRNHFFRFYQHNESSESKLKFRQASNHCEKVIEAAKFAYGNKTKKSITSQKLSPRDFWWIPSSFLNKSKSAAPRLSNVELPRGIVFCMIKQNFIC